MSSFIVDKKEYVKAAGLMYGIEESKRDKHQYFLDHCRSEFCHAYLLNVVSVNEQYGHHEPAVPDGQEYDELFEKYRKLGGKVCGDTFCRFGLQQLRPRLMCFFQSVLYQIEDETCHRTVAAWFYACIVKLYERDIRAVEGWWGDVELEDELKAA